MSFDKTLYSALSAIAEQERRSVVELVEAVDIRAYCAAGGHNVTDDTLTDALRRLVSAYQGEGLVLR